jgi:hypothetical protein
MGCLRVAYEFVPSPPIHTWKNNPSYPTIQLPAQIPAVKGLSKRVGRADLAGLKKQP